MSSLKEAVKLEICSNCPRNPNATGVDLGRMVLGNGLTEAGANYFCKTSREGFGIVYCTLERDQALVELAEAYIGDVQYAWAVEGWSWRREDFKSDEAHELYDDEANKFFEERRRAKESGEYYTEDYQTAHPGPYVSTERRWRDFLGIKWTNALWSWFGHEPDSEIGWWHDPRDDRGHGHGKPFLILQERDPEFFEKCRALALKHGGRGDTGMGMAGRGSSSAEELVVDVLKSWELEIAMTEAYERLSPIAEELGLTPWDLCR